MKFRNFSGSSCCDLHEASESSFVHNVVKFDLKTFFFGKFCCRCLVKERQKCLKQAGGADFMYGGSDYGLEEVLTTGWAFERLFRWFKFVESLNLRFDFLQLN